MTASAQYQRRAGSLALSAAAEAYGSRTESCSAAQAYGHTRNSSVLALCHGRRHGDDSDMWANTLCTAAAARRRDPGASDKQHAIVELCAIMEHLRAGLNALRAGSAGPIK